MDQRSIEKHLRRWLRRGKSNPDPLIGDADEQRFPRGRVHNPMTDDGLPVEGQVHKEWDPNKGGLPTFFGARVSGR